jgi:hypothetical protein
MKYSQFLLLIIFLASGYSCKKSTNSIAFQNLGPDVYVSGGDGGGALYWKNGFRIYLSMGAYASSISISGNDVYVAGIVNSGVLDSGYGNYTYAAYWKNDSLVDLTDGTTLAWTSSIFVSGSENDVYVTGWEIRNRNIPEYWKNGNLVILPDDTTRPEGGTSIYVSGNDIYVAGSETAHYWKNGNNVILNTSVFSTTSSIIVSGNDVYVAGFVWNGTYSIAEYWKNGNPVILSQSPNSAQATSIFVAGNDVYVAGFENDGNQNVAKYWKNGIPVNLTDGTTQAYAASIFVFGNDVYVAGYENDGPNESIAKYWKNGSPVILPTSADGGVATGIFVK